MKYDKVLVVDDQPMALTAFRRMLARLGYRNVILTTSAVEALELARRERPDLAIVDLNLQMGECGIALTRALRVEHPTLVIGIVSGGLDPKSSLESIRASANWFLVKTHDLDELRDAIENGGVPPSTIPSLQPELELDRVTKRTISMALWIADGNKSKAARLVGRTRNALHLMMQRLGIQLTRAEFVELKTTLIRRAIESPPPPTDKAPK